MFASVTDTTVPADDFVPGTPNEGFGSTVADVISTVADNLGNNVYQTGLSLVVATAAIVAMLNVGVHRMVLVPVGIGAFWAGWLGWNTFTGQNNPLFPGDVSATKLWDVAFTSESGFLIVVVVACVAAILLWRKGTALSSKLVMIAGAILGASFLYNLFEAVRYA
ncbi:MAG TPA: hypothetical protein VF065_04535 [Ilumatobacter sp.]